ncbi:MAG: hypothetical protein ABIH37_00215 [archaeon]
MDVVSETPQFNLTAFRDENVLTTLVDHSPPMIVRTGPYGNYSAFSGGPGNIEGSSDMCVFSPRVTVRKGSFLERCVLFPKVTIGENVQIRNAFVDTDNDIPKGMRIGYDDAEDRANGLYVDSSGIVVVPKFHFKPL